MLEVMSLHWNGERWRLWSFLAGLASIPVSALVALVIGAVTGERVVPLILLFLVALILIASLIGSGIIDTLSSQMNRGGLARESTDDIDRALEEGGATESDERNREQDDRRTIRAGLFILAPIAAFVYFMTIV